MGSQEQPDSHQQMEGQESLRQEGLHPILRDAIARIREIDELTRAAKSIDAYHDALREKVGAVQNLLASLKEFRSNGGIVPDEVFNTVALWSAQAEYYLANKLYLAIALMLDQRGGEVGAPNELENLVDSLDPASEE